uniref:RNA helicase n=1 Tax=Macrostomum lignano TaxID=282301 RepID=A0A1I8I7E0_9PLAT
MKQNMVSAIKSGQSPNADTFDDLPLNDTLKRSIRNHGFIELSTIQNQAFPLYLNGENVFVQSPSGTGKMSMAAISVLQSVKLPSLSSTNPDNPVLSRTAQALVLTPTREMALSASCMFNDLGKSMGVLCCACVGGIKPRDQKTELDAGVDIAIGTPGRVEDLINRGWLSTAQIRLIILTETDDLIRRGFKNNLINITSQMPEGLQVLIFSPTAPVELMELLNSLNLNPSPVHVRPNLDRP